MKKYLFTIGFVALATMFLNACSDAVGNFEEEYGYLDDEAYEDENPDTKSSSSSKGGKSDSSKDEDSSSSVNEESSSSKGSKSSSSSEDRDIYKNDKETGTFTDKRDGQVYQTVPMGPKLWFAENLRYKTESSSDEDSPFGAYYTFYDAISDVCPTGWHLATISDYYDLLDFVKSKVPEDSAAISLKSKRGWTPEDGTNLFGFNALPTGRSGYTTNQSSRGSAHFWIALAGTGNGYSFYIEDNEINTDLRPAYERKTVRCVNDNLVCGKTLYDSTANFCDNEKLYDMCGGKAYDPSNFSCEKDSIIGKCGKAKFNTFTEFCEEDKVYPLCKGADYDILTKFCHDDEIYSKCGGKQYNPSTHKCVGTNIVAYCGKSNYDESVEFCGADTAIHELCSGKAYNVLDSSCVDGTVLPLCGSTPYEPAGEFKCTDGKLLATMTDSRDNKEYTIVKIGDQVWMAENLNFDDNDPTLSSCYEQKNINCSSYGRLYTWYGAMACTAESCKPELPWQGICPDGWHVPQSSEWFTLTQFASQKSKTFEDPSLRSVNGWSSGGYQGTDEFGFNVLPSGKASGLESYSGEGTYAYFWEADKKSSSAPYLYFNYNQQKTSESSSFAEYRHSLRCIRGEANNPADYCDGLKFNRTTHFCYNKMTFSKCNGKAFNPDEQGCTDGKVLPLCGKSTFDSTTHFCGDDKTVHELCGGEKYDIFTQYCSEGSIRPAYDETANTLTDVRDTQVYRTTTIGNQVWMAENLNYEYNQYTAKSFCYDNEDSNCDTYGRLYSFSAALDSVKSGCGKQKDCSIPTNEHLQGVCPSGWHVPKPSEFKALVEYIGDNSSAGDALKSKDGWTMSNDDTYGFSVLPGGYMNASGNFTKINEETWFVTAKSYYDSNAFIYSMTDSPSSFAGKSGSYPIGAFYVRCLKD